MPVYAFELIQKNIYIYSLPIYIYVREINYTKYYIVKTLSSLENIWNTCYEASSIHSCVSVTAATSICQGWTSLQFK